MFFTLSNFAVVPFRLPVNVPPAMGSFADAVFRVAMAVVFAVTVAFVAVRFVCTTAATPAASKAEIGWLDAVPSAAIADCRFVIAVCAALMRVAMVVKFVLIAAPPGPLGVGDSTEIPMGVAGMASTNTLISSPCRAVECAASGTPLGH